MNKKKIELQVLNISNSQAQAGAYALVLGEVGGKRQLPIIIGATEAQAMVIEMKGIVPPRPLTHNLFASVLEVLGVKLMRILIYKVDNGVFYSYLYMKAEETILRIDARTSDAVALALRMNAPIFVYEEILETECLKTGESTTDPMGGSEPDENGIYPTVKAEKTKTPQRIYDFYKNDAYPYGEYFYPYESGTFKWYLRQYVEKVREKGGIPVIITPVCRMLFDSEGKVR